MFKKHFTPKEANKRLPFVKKVVLDILSKGRLLRTLLEEVEGPEAPEEVHNLKSQIEELIIELEELGCFYKDLNFEMGLVDFPAMINDKQVFLCWRSDEEAVQWFHSIEGGYDGRKPIPKGLL